MANKAKKDFLEVKKDVEDEMINKILNYLRTGSMECLVNNKPGSYMTAYTSTQTFADLGDEQSEKLFTYFKKKITSFIEDCSHYLANVSNSYLIEEFITVEGFIAQLYIILFNAFHQSILYISFIHFGILK